MHSYGLTVVTPPAAEPVSTAGAKAHLGVGHDADDDYIDALVAAARGLVERTYGRQLVTATLRFSFAGFPADELRLPRNPLQSVSSVQYVAADGTLTTLDAGDYRVDAARDPALVAPAYGRHWPVTRPQSDAIRVTAVCGYGDPEDVPAEARQAVLLLVGHWYRTREAVTDAAMAAVPLAVEALCLSLWNGGY